MTVCQRGYLLEERLSAILGERAFQRNGLGAPPATAAIERELEEVRQQALDLRHAIEEQGEELGALREAYRRLMAEQNRRSGREP
ncbi:hypothetical protein [Streptomyces lydicus]|uniref:hypothetical protein n=1 Tax=Streptomyces lydicus TaxID=47763 RepID=UPI0036E0021E